MKKWNEMNGKERTLAITIPVIVVVIIILSIMLLGNKDTEDVLTENVETTETESFEGDYTLDVETIIKEDEVETSETESIEVVESTEVVEETEIVEEVESDEELITAPDGTTWTKEQVEAEPWRATGEDPQHTWYLGATWTASNGVVLKINDMWSEYAEPGVWEKVGGSMGAIWQEDPDADWSPNSEYSKAVNEFVYSDSAWNNGLDRYDSGVVDISKLPDVPTTSTKQTSFVTNDTFNEYKEGWDLYHTFQGTGEWTTSALYQLQVNSDFAGSSAGGEGYLWDIRRESDYWKITIRRNLSELNWDGMLNCLRLITPDAQAVYDAVYNVTYNDVPWILDYDGWYTIPNTSSEIYVTNTTGAGYMEYKFK